MSASNPGPVRRFFRALWRFIDASRRVVLNLVFLAILVAVAVALIKTGPAPIADTTALVLRLDGTISEQKTGTLRSSALEQVRGEAVQKILLRDVLAALDSAAADPKISSLVLSLDELRPTGFSTLREIAAGVDRFKASGKKVVAARRRPAPVLRASHADEVYLHPLGMVYIAGFGSLELLQGCARQAWRHRQRVRVGTFKSAVELFTPTPRHRLAEADAFSTAASEDLPRRGREGAKASRRRNHARHRRSAAAPRRGRRRHGQARAVREAGRRAEDARRAAHADDRARRPGRRREDLSPDLV
jgi:protease-4